MKRTLILIAVFVVSGASEAIYGQVLADLTFRETTFDFGKIEEQAGPVEHTFVFTNTSGKPVKIEGVKASCGCTTPGWTTEEVPAGGEGFVKASYNPLNRPGPFNKSLTVTTNSPTSRYVLYIKGDVKPKPRTIDDDFPTVMGGIRVKYRTLNMGRVLNHQPTSSSFEVYNSSDASIAFLDKMESPDYITVKVEPKTIQPKERARILVTYDVQKRNDLGFMSDNIALYTDESTDNKKSFSVFANIEEYFPPMNEEQLAAAPRLVLEKKVHDFGRIKSGSVVETVFVIKNEGQQTLNIRKTSSTCGCTVSKPGKEDIEPGERSEIKVTFNSAGRRGTQQKSVTIFSNDPKGPTQRLTIKAFVETDA